MEIAGSTCTVCGQHIVLARDGKSCTTCRIVVHRTCHTQSHCSRCGGVYQTQEPPVVDPVREATVPRNLRPVAPGSPAAMAIIGAVLCVVLFVVFIMFLLRNGH